MRIWRRVGVCVGLLLALSASPQLVRSASAQAAYVVKQSTGYTIKLPDIIASSDHITGLTGQAGTVYLSRVNGSTGAVTKAASTNNISEIDAVNAPGQYTLTLTTTETGTLGWIAGYYKAANSDPVGFTVKVVAYDPDSATNLGLSALPTANPAANGGLPTVDANNAVKLQSGTGANQISLASGAVTVGTNNDKTGYSLSVTPPTTAQIAAAILSTPANLLVTSAAGAVNVAAGQTFSTTGSVGSVTGAVASVTGAVGSVTGNVGGVSGVTFPSTVPSATGILDTALAGHTGAGSVGGALQAAGSAGDPWATALPGAYGVGTGGYIVGTYLDAAISSRLASAGYTVPPTTAQIAAAILLNPSNLLYSDTSGNAGVARYAAGQDPASLVMNATVAGGLTVKQAMAIGISVMAGTFTINRNTTNKTITVTYYVPANPPTTNTAMITLVTNYTDSTLTIATGRPTITYSNLP